ncbi:glycosyltransferase [Brasilonema sp. UFV-L1]|uniref:glycosyltransferase family 2 protein n=1 Tax=Brasilonema sp. UFV-L1 TaxID=2234130 RepID=UPI00145E0775|nr:glycosyltransferase [Brasilonema sp. UFV-L1]NMG06644.1 glycosyl transferase family 2 [Brasilonema sp. UFV-L1]
MNSFAPWKVLHIELSEDIPVLRVEPKYQGIYAVFWWCGIPLAHEEISAVNLPMSATQLVNLAVQKITPAVGDRLLNHGFKAPLAGMSQNPSRDTPPEFQSLIALEQPLQKLQEHSLQSVSASVSVVVCTRNRPEQLVRCLRSLQKLSPSPQQIIVVDNAPSDDATRQLVAQMPGIQYVLESRPGLSVARNTGIRHSTGDIIAFTDDDVEVHPDWIARLQQSFENPKVMAVTGLVLPGELETESQVAFEKGFGGFNRGYRVLTFDSQFFEEMKSRGVPVWYIGAGANMAFQRQVFERVGYFDERLGAGASGCSEDSEFWYRILAEGWFCRYEPTAVVYHYHRSDLDKLKQQMYQYMRGHVAALLIQFARYNHWGNLHRLFVALPKYYTRRFLSGLFKDLTLFNKMLFVEVLGCFSGVKYYLQNK